MTLVWETATADESYRIFYNIFYNGQEFEEAIEPKCRTHYWEVVKEWAEDEDHTSTNGPTYTLFAEGTILKEGLTLLGAKDLAQLLQDAIDNFVEPV
jgi:hypothetical protein